MGRRFDDHFVQPGRGLASVKIVADGRCWRAREKRWEFIGDDPHSPAGRVFVRRSRTHREHLMRRLAFMPLAEWARPWVFGQFGRRKIIRPFAPRSRNAHPAAGERILAKLEHAWMKR